MCDWQLWQPMTFAGRRRVFSGPSWRFTSSALTSVTRRGSSPPNPRTTAGPRSSANPSSCTFLTETDRTSVPTFPLQLQILTFYDRTIFDAYAIDLWGHIILYIFKVFIYFHLYFKYFNLLEINLNNFLLIDFYEFKIPLINIIYIWL